MAKYQVFVSYKDDFSASSKAQKDVNAIMTRNGYATEEIAFTKYHNKLLNYAARKISIVQGWIRIYKKLQRDDVLFWQGPNEYTHFCGRQILDRIVRKKKVHLIALLHDIDELRMTESLYLAGSKKQHRLISETADTIIVHTQQMKDWMVENGCPQEKMVVLGIFDYLSEADREKIAEPDIVKKIVIAGNLNSDKSGYLSGLKDIKEMDFILYGSNLNTQIIGNNTKYEGSFDSDEIIKAVCPGFGLVWDGESIDTCSGTFGSYLKYNSPHKLSLYLRIGLPVIVWAKSAQADYVKKAGVGICINSLKEIREKLDRLNKEELGIMLENSYKISRLLKNGNYLTQALRTAEDRITTYGN